MNGLRGVDRKYLITAGGRVLADADHPDDLDSARAAVDRGRFAHRRVAGDHRRRRGEMLASLGGIGFIITSSRNMYATGDVYFGIVLALFCALLANLGLSLIEQRFTRWRDLQASVR